MHLYNTLKDQYVKESKRLTTMCLIFVVFCSKKPFFLKCLQHFFQVDMEPFIEKNIRIQSQRVGMDCGRENENSKMDGNRRSF